MHRSPRWLVRFLLWSVLALAGLPFPVSAGEVVAEHVRVEYGGLDEAHAKAIAKTVSAARQAYIDVFRFQMPDMIHVKVDCGTNHDSRLFTDGKDRVFLSLPSADKLAPPQRSGTFNLYGLCHEVGHIAMYRVLTGRDWMTPAAAEGWAHYAGSAVVDRVYAKEGQDLWPTPYDYRADGTARLRRQLASPNATDVVLGARQWQRLADILGEDRFPNLFEAWQKAAADPLEPNAALGNAAVELFPDRRGQVEAWWKAAAPLFVEFRQRSDVKAQSVKPVEVTGKPVALSKDDGTSEGRRSIAGGGHARLFDSPGPDFYLTSVSFYGARYGTAKPPDQDFQIALCDDRLRPIAVWKKPYAAAPRGEMDWIKVEVPPTRVPDKFYLCLVFDPNATKGIYVGYDSSTKGHSQAGTPGRPGRPLPDADWMIRAELDRRKDADALGPASPPPESPPVYLWSHTWHASGTTGPGDRFGLPTAGKDSFGRQTSSFSESDATYNTHHEARARVLPAGGTPRTGSAAGRR